MNDIRNRLKSSLPILVTLVVFGCRPQSQEPLTIEGFVCATKDDIVESYILSAATQPKDFRPIAGVTIQLAFDQEGKDLVKGFEAKSDKNGRYIISTNGIPRSPNDYYLIVMEVGYEPLVEKLRIGILGRYMRNTVILKPLSKGKQKEIRP